MWEALKRSLKGNNEQFNVVLRTTYYSPLYNGLLDESNIFSFPHPLS